MVGLLGLLGSARRCCDALEQTARLGVLALGHGQPGEVRKGAVRLGAFLLQSVKAPGQGNEVGGAQGTAIEHGPQCGERWRRRAEVFDGDLLHLGVGIAQGLAKAGLGFGGVPVAQGPDRGPAKGRLFGVEGFGKGRGFVFVGDDGVGPQHRSPGPG